MSSYTTIFKAAIIPCSALAVFIFFHWSGGRLIQKSPHWVEAVESKLQLAQKFSPRKYLFIGPSTTQNHIDTFTLKKEGLEGFNFGLPGHGWSNFTHPARVLAKRGYQKVVLTVMPEWLFQKMRCPLFMYLDEISFFYSIGRSDCLLKWDWTFLFKLKALKPFLGTAIYSEELAKRTVRQNPSFFQIERPSINSARKGSGRLVVTFENGDGVIFGQGPLQAGAKKQILDFTGRTLSPSAASYLKRLQKILQDEGADLILVVDIPRAGQKIILEKKKIEKKLASLPVIFFHDLEISPKLYSDRGHLNHRARAIFTKLLKCELESAQSTGIEFANLCEKLRLPFLQI